MTNNLGLNQSKSLEMIITAPPCTQALAVRHREIRGMPLAECRDISDGGPLQKILNVADAKVAADSPQRIDSGNSSAHCIVVQVNWVACIAYRTMCHYSEEEVILSPIY